MYTMPKCQVQLPSDEAFHARMGAWIVKAVQDLEAEVAISDGRKRANAQSVFSLLTLGAEPGTLLTVHAEGADADEAILAIRETMISATFAQNQD